MMNKKAAAIIAKLWNEEKRGSYVPTMTEAQVISDGGKSYSVHIMPIGDNDGHTFHHIEEVTDICRAFGVSGYVSARIGDKGKAIIIARIF